MPVAPRLIALLFCSALGTWPALAQTTDAPPLDSAGPYLAARQAATANDFAAAALWYDKAAATDPANPALLEGATSSHLALGNIQAAAKAALALQKTGSNSQIAAIALATHNAMQGDFAAILQSQADGHTIGTLMDKLVRAWAEVGMGRMTQALADFDSVIKDPGTATFGTYHKALALASTGDFEGADKLLSAPAAQGVMQLRRAVVARAQILSQLERNKEAIALLDTGFGNRPDPGIADLRRRLAAGEPVAFDINRNATDGLAEVFFSLATALGDQAGDSFTLLYAQIAAALRPDHVEAQLLAAGMFEKLGQFDLATASFAKITPSDPAYVAAQIGAADAAMQAGRLDDAVILLQDLSTRKPGDIAVLTALGDALHRQDNCETAIKAYDGAIALVPNPAPGNWPLFYKRAACYLNLDNFPAAEADYRRALTLAPDEPRILNELGYSYVDRGERLDEALAMIQKAVAGSPESGYIVDSLAWAYFRLGRYADAVAPQEKASKLMPVDPIVTDHLGDIYWMVGRKREAQFQWRRALSFGPEDKEKLRIQRKIEVGLDVVLDEEKAANGN